MWLDDAYTDCRPYAAATQSCHPRTMSRGKTVCIKYLRMTQQNREAVEKVCLWFVHSILRPLKETCGAGILQGGDHVEEAEASERGRLHRSYAKTPAICIRVDAERNSNRLSQ